MTTDTRDIVESDSDVELIKLEDVHFPGGIRPFQEPPKTSDNTDLDYYAILGLDCKASDTDIKSAVRAMSMFYHPDRRRRVFRNVETPEGLDQECDKILEYVRMAKNTLENEGEHRNYNFLHFQVGEYDEREILKHDKAEAEELVRNMRMTAQFIEEEELRKENEGLIIEEAWFGAIMDSVDPNLTIEDMQLGRIIDVRIPMTIQIIDSKITRDNKEQGYSLTKVPGFYDCCVGEEKRLFVRYRFHRLTFIMNIGEHDRILIPSRYHFAHLPGEEFPEKKTEEQRAEEERQAMKAMSHAPRSRNRLDDLILHDEEKPRFRLRYVVYVLGVVIGVRLAYKKNTGFRYACDSMMMSYRCGSLVQDLKGLMGTWIFGENSKLRSWGRELFWDVRNRWTRLLSN